MAGGSLANILNKGSESLANSRSAVDVTGHNITNAHTPGYSRQIINFETKTPIAYGMHIFGDGAQIQSIARAHDELLEGQVRREIQIQGKNEALAKGLQKLESLFNPDLNSTIRDRLVSFSNAVRELANSPEEPSNRINVVETGKGLTQTFNAAHAGVLQVQRDANEEIQQNIGNVNEKLVEIARLNGEIRQMGAGNLSQVNDLLDKQDKVIKEVGNLIDINVYKDKNNQVIVRGPNESLLVENDHASHLISENNFSTNTMPNILVSEFDKPLYMDVTKKITKGQIGALLEIRDHHAQIIRDNINTLAQGFGDKFNSIHEQGYGVKEMGTQKGRIFFSGLDGEGEPAQDISVDMSIVTNLNAVATAMTPGAEGDNVIVNKLVKMFYEPFFDDNSTTVTGLYDKTIAQLGHQTLQTKEQAVASKIVFDKLKAQQESYSGVSLDEEAASLLKYQHLFNASSKIITTANEMYQTILDLKR